MYSPNNVKVPHTSWISLVGSLLDSACCVEDEGSHCSTRFSICLLASGSGLDSSTCEASAAMKSSVEGPKGDEHGGESDEQDAILKANVGRIILSFFDMYHLLHKNMIKECRAIVLQSSDQRLVGWLARCWSVGLPTCRPESDQRQGRAGAINAKIRPEDMPQELNSFTNISRL